MINSNNRIKILKICLFSLVCIIAIGLIIYLFPLFLKLNTVEGQLAFKEKVGDNLFNSMLALFALQFLQILLIFVPGEPIEILCGMMYGAFWGTLYVMVSAAIVTIAIFVLVRKFGRKFVYDFCGKEKIDKIEQVKILKDEKKLKLSFLILYLIPGTTKDLFAYVGGLVKIKALDFILISSFARFPSVISSTLAGANLANGNIWMSIFVYIATFVVVGITIFIINIFDKNKIAREVLKIKE